MLSILLLAALMCMTSAAPGRTTQAPLLAADSTTAIQNEYLVRLNPETTDEQVEAHLSRVNQLLTISTTSDSKIMHTWHIGSFRGYSVRMDDQSLEKLREMENIMYVERNQEVHAFCTDQIDAEWGLCRTTVRDWNPPDPNYSYDERMSGEGVDAYVIDTGVYTEHNDFGGRAKWGVDYVDTPSPETDLNGHGTHVAGTIAGIEYGIAKSATIIAVRVLNAGGSGTFAGVIAGINWVADEHVKSRRKSVANLSLGGGASTAVNEAIEAAFEAGVIMVSAAGNERQSACNVSPASADGITVAASDSNDVLAIFSNYDADCVEIIAPGVNIKAPWIGSPDATNTISGTSMAAPHVAGVLAKYLSGPDAPSKPSYNLIKDYLDETSTKDKIIYGGDQHLNNHLIFMECV